MEIQSQIDANEECRYQQKNQRFMCNAVMFSFIE